jgi:hypothetical protein
MRAKLDIKTTSAVAMQDMTLKEHASKAPDFSFHEDCFCTTDGNRAIILNNAPCHTEVWWSELYSQIQELPPVKHEGRDLDEKLEKALRELGLSSSPKELD